MIIFDHIFIDSNTLLTCGFLILKIGCLAGFFPGYDIKIFGMVRISEILSIVLGIFLATKTGWV